LKNVLKAPQELHPIVYPLKNVLKAPQELHPIVYLKEEMEEMEELMEEMEEMEVTAEETYHRCLADNIR
jgi:hypothetical protein